MGSACYMHGKRAHKDFGGKKTARNGSLKEPNMCGRLIQKMNRKCIGWCVD